MTAKFTNEELDLVAKGLREALRHVAAAEPGARTNVQQMFRYALDCDRQLLVMCQGLVDDAEDNPSAKI